MSLPDRYLLLAITSITCFIGAVGVLTHQTPYCYTRQEFRDGRIDYREFSSESEAFAYESSRGFWSDNPDVVSEASGCSSDKVYPWEGALGGALAVAGFVIPVASARAGGAPAMAGAFAKTILGLATGFAFISLISIGTFIAPWLIPLHWLAARRSTRWMRGIWITAAAGCAWVLGSLIGWSLLRHGSFESEVLPFAVAAAVIAVFVPSTSPSIRDAL